MSIVNGTSLEKEISKSIASEGHSYMFIEPDDSVGYIVNEYDIEHSYDLTIRNNGTTRIEVYLVLADGSEDLVACVGQGVEVTMNRNITDELMVRSSADQTLKAVIICNGDESVIEITEDMTDMEPSRVERLHKPVVLDRDDWPIYGFLYNRGLNDRVPVYEHPDSTTTLVNVEKKQSEVRRIFDGRSWSYHDIEATLYDAYYSD